MFGMGMPEILLILAIALIVIGPKKLPDLAKSLGRAMGEFKKATREFKETMEIDSELKDVKNAFNDMNADIKDSVNVDFGETMRTSTDSVESDDKSGAKTPEHDQEDSIDGDFDATKNIYNDTAKPDEDSRVETPASAVDEEDETVQKDKKDDLEGASKDA
jgi:TatA/E family protein of Tat protein translocase